MKAVLLTGFGGPDVLRAGEVPTPEPGPGEVRVRVRAVAVARTKDVATRAGRPPFGSLIRRFPHVLGTEHAGVVDAAGPGVSAALVGRRVGVSAILPCGKCRACQRGREEACPSLALIGVHRPGSYAEYCVAPAAGVHVLPDDVSDAEAASLAANGPVARAQLDAGDVREGGTVLVVGASGSLGSTVAALAAYRGATVIGVARTSRRPDGLTGLPLAAALDATADLADHIREATGGEGVDCVIDNLGVPALWEAYRPALATMGRIVVSGAIEHDPVPLRLLPFYLRSQSLIGVRTGNRRQIGALWQDVRAGFRPPPFHLRQLPWTDAPLAHRQLEEGTASGQTILEIP
ncbi:quinone oxidoreductase family protein [Actinomadura decatromicini]|uniref:alcohol dehydrogenase n=1 Tax=Actinomadura decatromicini TaxID=2604572 RepID=A0A5D3FYA2_9ACTN|nr:alcohol dehydrogenase catalytic domain-containing protein [Actinomadura decatromicini]TYK53154.1 alcohol dehydrogenase catalytic domain-containing protein [Actinomadura decatromicini]